MFDFYFTGVPATGRIADFLIANDCCLLLSQLNDRSACNKWINKLKENPHSKMKLFIDSGAFSAWTKGKEIDIDEYINFINTNKDYLTICASVDTIPGKPRSSTLATPQETRIAAENTWKNFLYMRSKMDDVNKLLYTFHAGEPFEFLERALNYKDDKGLIDYIAFGGLVGKSANIIESFLNKAIKIVQSSPNPNVKIHAFGMTRKNYLEQFPLTSCDSTSWVQQAAFGTIVINNKTILVTNRKKLSEDSIFNKNPALLQEVERIIKERGFTLDELAEDSEARGFFNVKEIYHWAKNYKFEPIKVEKNSLW